MKYERNKEEDDDDGDNQFNIAVDGPYKKFSMNKIINK